MRHALHSVGAALAWLGWAVCAHAQPISLFPAAPSSLPGGIDVVCVVPGAGNHAMLCPPSALGGGSGGSSSSAGVSAFNARTGAVSLTGADVSGVGGLLASNNLSDLASAASARTNLGLGGLATLNAVPCTDLPAFTGDVTAAGCSLTLASVVTAGTSPKVTYNAKGLVTGGSALAPADITGGGGLLAANNLSDLASPAAALAHLGAGSLATLNSVPCSDLPQLTGDATSTGCTVTLPSVATAGTYPKVTINAKGLVTAGVALASSDVTSALGFTPLSTAGGTMTGPTTFNAAAPSSYVGIGNYLRFSANQTGNDAYIFQKSANNSLFEGVGEYLGTSGQVLASSTSGGGLGLTASAITFSVFSGATIGSAPATTQVFSASTTQLYYAPAGTNLLTVDISGNVVAAASISTPDIKMNGQDLGAPWTSFALTPACSLSGGTISLTGASSGRYRKVGRTVNINYNLGISASSNCGNVVINLPVIPAAFNYIIQGREDVQTGSMIVMEIPSGNQTALIARYDNAPMSTAGYQLDLSGTYESAS